MITCTNQQCENYKKELDDNVELCPSCGMKTEKIKSKTNKNLSAIAILAAVIGAVLVLSMIQSFGVSPIGFVFSVAGVVLAFISRSKVAVIISIAGLAANIIIAAVMLMA